MDLFIASVFHFLLNIIAAENRLTADENEIAPFLDTNPDDLRAAIQEHPEQLCFPASILNGVVQIPILPFIQCMTGGSLRSIERIIEEMLKATAQEHGILTND